MSELAYCGLECHNCRWREENNCPGCHAASAKMFWGECPLASCAITKGIETCAQCPDMPCEQLKRFAADPEHSDGSNRIDNLRKIM